MLRTADISAFLQAQGVTVPIYTEMEEPAKPDRLVLLVLTGGAGTRLERAFDLQTVQVRTRGAGNNQADAEALASQVDDALMGASCPAIIGGKSVLEIDYVGGPPAFLSRDDSRRTMLSCNYLFEVARSVR